MKGKTRRLKAKRKAPNCVKESRERKPSQKGRGVDTQTAVTDTEKATKAKG